MLPLLMYAPVQAITELARIVSNARSVGRD
jgi:hypothetical protein